MFLKCFGNVLEMSWKCLGNVLEMFIGALDRALFCACYD